MGGKGGRRREESFSFLLIFILRQETQRENEKD